MPVNKDAMARYRIIDEMLADPYKNYTTNDILERVLREFGSDKSLSRRMIQKDIKALEGEPFNKKIVRNAGGRGTVRYADPTTRLFYQELTSDEEEILKEALGSLGKFEGLENFRWLEDLGRKLDMDSKRAERPVISFSRNDILQIPDNLLGQLFCAISRRKVIRFGYRRFEDAGKAFTRTTVYPYQLRQYNNRWFLLCNPVGNEQYPFDPERIYNYALDRMDGRVDYVDDMPYIDTPVDIDARFAEIVGVTYYEDSKVEDIYFAVGKGSLDYIRTKAVHVSQDEVNPEVEKEFKARYPSLSDCRFFVISCRPNRELFALLASFGKDLTVVEPESVRDTLRKMFEAAAVNYASL